MCTHSHTHLHTHKSIKRPEGCFLKEHTHDNVYTHSHTHTYTRAHNRHTPATHTTPGSICYLPCALWVKPPSTYSSTLATALTLRPAGGVRRPDIIPLSLLGPTFPPIGFLLHNMYSVYYITVSTCVCVCI